MLCQTARAVEQFFQDHSINFLKSSANRPNIAPVENIKACLKQRLRKQGLTSNPEAIHFMLAAVNDADDVAEICPKLVDSMPKRVEMCITSKGGH